MTDVQSQQSAVALNDWFQDVNHGHRTPLVQGPVQDDLDDLIIEREWFDKKFPQRVAALVRHHRKQHGKDPNRAFLPMRFANWIHKRWGDRVNFEIPPEPTPLLMDPESGEIRTEPRPAMIETMSLIVVPNLGDDSYVIQLDTVLKSSEAQICCGPGEVSVRPVTETDKP